MHKPVVALTTKSRTASRDRLENMGISKWRVYLNTAVACSDSTACRSCKDSASASSDLKENPELMNRANVAVKNRWHTLELARKRRKKKKKAKEEAARKGK